MTELDTEAVLQIGQEPFGLRPGELIGPTSEVLAQLLYEIPEENPEDFWLFRQTAVLGEGLGIDDEDRASILGLVKGLYEVDPEFARSSMEALPIALATADVIEEAGVFVDKKLVWKGVIHDIGKQYVNSTTRARSNGGAPDYGPADHSQMEPHVVYGWLGATFGGQSEANFLPAGHHLLQPDNPYGVDIEFDTDQHTALLCVANGDATGAILTRNNNRAIVDENWDTQMALRRERQHEVLTYMYENHPILKDKDPVKLAELTLERTWHPREPRKELSDRESPVTEIAPGASKVAEGILVLAGR